MAKISRNTKCPCGSGKKYKHCCEQKEAALRQADLPSGRFRYESGSYGNERNGFMPSILCYKQLASESWTEHFCLAKPDAIQSSEDEAVVIAEQHLANAHALKADGGSIQDFALSLRHAGYKNVTGFHIVGSETDNEV